MIQLLRHLKEGKNNLYLYSISRQKPFQNCEYMVYLVKDKEEKNFQGYLILFRIP
ncbi:hypothetical protein AN2V17_37750 [Vallitalea sp. AN17-2]|uniref:Uncharacterized protein n=1 Tax=Vallitalea maricola TaxID=3074433 RepID=A0ACB5UPS6_9FIRM|nr:hypothetical protein AN2V17_37750 [Vallitalea sp. AN17-2]